MKAISFSLVNSAININGRKRKRIDYQTGEQVPLFNPRQQRWEDHSSWSVDGVEIIGITAIGRATVLALRLNNDLALIVRKNWIRAGWQPQ